MRDYLKEAVERVEKEVLSGGGELSNNDIITYAIMKLHQDMLEMNKRLVSIDEKLEQLLRNSNKIRDRGHFGSW